MGFNIKRRIYESLPIPLKRSICLVPFHWLAGKVYRQVYQRRVWFEQAKPEQLKGYQEKELGAFLQFVVSKVPAYKNFQAVVERHRPFEALKAFPFLDKDTLQADQHLYLPENFHKIPHYETTTGGTSGNQLKIYVDDCSQAVETAFMHRQWARVGYSPHHRKATFRGVSFPNLKTGVFWQHNPIYNELQFSPFHMSEGNLGAYVEEIQKFKPEFLHGYPSALDLLAEYTARHDMTGDFPKIKAALLGSEGVTPGQRKRIETAFNTRVYSWYGHSERVILAGECETSQVYHHFPDYGILEIVDDRGISCEKEGERGEIIGTGLLNRCMPLIRYRTGDYATRRASQCSCGRHWDRFDAVEGRWKQEMIIGKSGAPISIAALNMHGPLFERVVRYQYFQDTVGICTLKIMQAPEFTATDRELIEAAYRKKVGDEIQFHVQIVDDIPLTARGKLKLLDSRLQSG